MSEREAEPSAQQEVPDGHAEQLTLLKSRVRAKRPKPQSTSAPERPVAQVALDVPLAHLDRPFDYVVSAPQHDDCVPGCRVKVRFSGRDVDGFVLDRVEASDHPGRLAPLRRVVSAEPVLHHEILEVARLVADRYAGTLADVLRLAVPPRHGRVESESPRAREAPQPIELEEACERWAAERGGASLVRRLASGESPRAVWTAPPRADWPAQLAAAAAATLRSGRGSLLCVPDTRDVARLDAALRASVGPEAYVVLTSDLGPAARYRAFLALSRGDVQVVVGTRAAALAPVHDLGLVAVWDDGDDLLAEPRAPYPHAREVLALRAYHQHAAALFGGHARSAEAQLLVESGWAAELQAPRAHVRDAAPQVHITGESDREAERESSPGARMPRRVFEVVRRALEVGPVLVHTPRYGYQPALACATCWGPARCAACTGPLARSAAGSDPSCRWCGTPAADWTCGHCRGQKLRAPVVGTLRTAEEWGRSFPHTVVRTSGGDHVLDALDDEAAIVIATPGAEPTTVDGYAAAIILDSWLSLSRPSMRAGEEALRRWVNLAALVRSGPDGGRVVVVGEPGTAVLQALVRWDPAGFASRELADRASARLSPATRMASLTAPQDVLEAAVAALDLPPQADVLGPVEAGDGEARVVVRTSRERGAGLSRALRHLQAGRSSRKLPHVRVQVDPTDLV